MRQLLVSWIQIGIVAIILIGLVEAYNPIGDGICDCWSCGSCERATDDGDRCWREIRMTDDIEGTNCLTIDERNRVFNCQGFTIRSDWMFAINLRGAHGTVVKNCRIKTIGGKTLDTAIRIHGTSNFRIENSEIDAHISGGWRSIWVQWASGTITGVRFNGTCASVRGCMQLDVFASTLNISENRFVGTAEHFWIDLNSPAWGGSHGINNMCKRPGSWNDTGTVGCKYWDWGECRCWDCTDCNFKGSDAFCNNTRLINNITVNGSCIRGFMDKNRFIGNFSVIRGNDSGVGVAIKNIENLTVRNFEIGINYSVVNITRLNIFGNRIGINATNLTIRHTRVCDNALIDINVSVHYDGHNNTCDSFSLLVNDTPSHPDEHRGCFRRCEYEIEECTADFGKGRWFVVLGIRNGSDCIRVENVTNKTIRCVGVIDGNDTGFGIRVRNASFILIRDCPITQFHQGIEVIQSNNITLRNNTIYHIRRYALYLDHSNGTLENNTFFVLVWSGAIKSIRSNFTMVNNTVLVNYPCVDDPNCVAALVIVLAAGGGLAVWYYRRQHPP